MIYENATKNRTFSVCFGMIISIC